MVTSSPSQALNDLLITRNFNPESLDINTGKPPVDATGAPDPSAADMFTFNWVAQSGKNYGTVVILLSSDNGMTVFYGDNLGRGMDAEDKTEWYQFLEQLKSFAVRNSKIRGGFKLDNISRLKYTMAGMAAIKEGLFESYYGNKKISYAGEPTHARLMIKHSRNLEENDARFRYVESLFIETADGERFKLPFKKLAGGRAMVEHVKQGGNPYDIRGQHISQIVEQLNVLSQFRRANQKKVFEGVAGELVTETNMYYTNLQRNLKTLSSSHGYNQYFESWSPADISDSELVVEDLKNLFVETRIDPRIEQALPMLARIQQETNTMKEAQIFEDWVNNVMEGTWALPDTPEAQAKLDTLMSQELIVGPDATNATEQLYDVIGDDQLFDILNNLADQDPRANIWDDTDVQARLQQLGIQMNTTPAAAQQQPVAPAAGQQAPGTAPDQAVAEAIPAAGVDPKATQQYAQQIVQALQQATGATVKDFPNQDGTVKIVINPDPDDRTYPPSRGYIVPTGNDGATMQNITKAINPYYNTFRQKGWRFDQPVGGAFTIGIPTQQAVAENTELNDMLKYAGVPVSESRIHENSEYTYEKVAKILAREKPGMATDKTSNDFYSAVYHELIAIGMTPKAARNLISHDEDFMGDVASAYNHYQSNPGLDETNHGVGEGVLGAVAGSALGSAVAGPVGGAIGSALGRAATDGGSGMVESSCNTTMEGEYCPEHGLAECGMYEMGTVAGSVAPMMEDHEHDAWLARIKTLALIK